MVKYIIIKISVNYSTPKVLEIVEKVIPKLSIKSLNYFGFEKTLSILDGMFAFAYYDLKTKVIFS